jgi:ABC-type antimicrobial peptide transport system, permease component
LNLFERAIKNLKIYKNRMLIIFGIVFILSNVIACCLAISQETIRVESEMKNKIGAYISFIDPRGSEPLSAEELAETTPTDYLFDYDNMLKIGTFSEVASFDFLTYLIMFSHEVKPVGSVFQEPNNGYSLNLVGVNHPNFYITNNEAELLTGRTFTQLELDDGSPVTVITSMFAKENNLSVGSKFKINNYVFDNRLCTEGNQCMNVDYDIMASRETEVEVIGIYEPKLLTTVIGSDPTDPLKEININDYRMNNNLFPNNFILAEKTFHDETYNSVTTGVSADAPQHYDPVYILNSPDDITTFKQKITEYVPKKLNIVTSADSYEKVAKPIATYKTITTIVLYVSIFVTVIILAIMVLNNIHDRTLEFGVLLSLGEKKFKIIAQVLLELLLVVITAISFSVFTGNFIAQNIGIYNEIVQPPTELISTPSYSTLEVNNLGTILTEDEVLAAYEINISLEYIAFFYLIIIGTISIAIIIPIINILRLNPKKILIIT